MNTVYVSQQGCYLSLKKELLIVKHGNNILEEVQMPLVEQILIMGKSQITTQAIRACLIKNIPIVYLSRMGYCYGRTISIERGYRYLSRYQQLLDSNNKITVAKAIVKAKLANSRVILRRQQQRKPSIDVSQALNILSYLMDKVSQALTINQLMGYEGAGASAYFSALGQCITNPDFIFFGRSRRPPGNPVNALLSFGYQILWNHLLVLIELQGLDPYYGCLHQANERHPVLASDLVEEFRASIIDSLVLYLVNKNIINSVDDFTFKHGGCYLNHSGRKKFLNVFIQRMEELIDTGRETKQPRWDLLTRQVRRYKNFVYHPVFGYQPYRIR
ncbi:CRISPR-associated endonuclease Cas1 [Cyanobacterium stanieri LEGE 03274]|uniref:CRISPR-associated endonuclease Cas1 n=1 Tax=Cyanobacterium stanieri LEGE 03274 TaxID=1828756 RepID=A0ABR9V2I5_9CHRO|nr:CRISPR-associated endonuclease Cas1 [Cyanobacterium stanieri]MBE9221769.1 CRISPR-associated endonuclease Cas1 [Cyanobacterium stanieri LEGE 03274]